ncbi:MaoC family dehydratase N-terminal domain-containing protein [Thermocrispum municipale]|jgi:acyl dehydratase|uniref:MaoC family dehydratase N-terminal domain-containing protein n=1 Tax=Thermocrispum municipale TaxID=37926 RepID=UPI0004012B06|nr:MaoC family dehydratase N-terminal domain-containing protein [Thermocrispum municipale]
MSTIDTSAIGRELPEASMLVERGRLRLFCKAIGETDPVYTDVDAARAAGHPDLPAPPTFLCAIQHERDNPFDWLNELGSDLTQVLHGEQHFTYHALAYAGDRLVLSSRIADIYQRKGGALNFIVRNSIVRRGETTVAELKDIVVIPGGHQ